MWKHGTGESRRAEEMHLEERAQVGVGRLLERSDVGPPGVVDQHVDPAMLMEHIVHRRFDTGSVGHIKAHGVDRGVHVA